MQVDEAGVAAPVALAGLLLTLAAAAAAVAVGALASRRTVGAGAGPALVLVGVPVLTALLGTADSPVARALVPGFAPALRAAYDGRLIAAAPGLGLQTLLWAGVVLLALGVLRRP